jgi:transposase-like protein
MTHPDQIGDELDIHALSPHLRDHAAAIEYLERLRWPDGRVCPHCGVVDSKKREHYRIKAKSTRRKLWKCYSCRKQFSVTVGTIFEDSHITLDKWLLAFHLLCSSKKGMSALQIQRMLRLKSYSSAWHLCHRIRWAMAEPAFTRLLGGTVEADETYIGGKARNRHRMPPKPLGPRQPYANPGKRRTGRGSEKAPVMVLVERGGEARSFHVANVTANELKGAIRRNVAHDTRMMTDAFKSYAGLDREFASHEVVNHADDEWVRGEAHTNTAENFFSILKRGINGSYHHVSEAHLHRYLSEFDFRYNNREANGVDDAERTRRAIAGADGKRLMYRDSR